jgi:predicted DNA-binding ribbon-helix-helix protein
MCGIYTNADPILYESRTRSVRLHGVLTTVRLENLFWDVLREIAEREDLTTSQFMAKLHDELMKLHGETHNFASFLRVCCLRYLSLLAAATMPANVGNSRPGHTQSSMLKAVR